MSKILFITPMWYEEAFPKDPKVCNYFVDEWIKQEHKVVVVHCYSQFPWLYRRIGGLLPFLTDRLCGDNAGMNLNTREYIYDYNGSLVMSIPIYKYIPHGSFSKKTLNNYSHRLISELRRVNFVPDVIIGHFCNPAMEIITRIRMIYPNVKTAVVLHEGAETVSRIFGRKAECLLNEVDSIGYRSLSIQRSIESKFKLNNSRFICYSGISSFFFKKKTHIRKWEEGSVRNFLFVGRLVYYKHPLAVIQALGNQYPDRDFNMRYIGTKGRAYSCTREYVEKNRLNNSVSFLGQINREDLVSWYDQSDCFVMISDHEVFGLVYLEAMARGCITIAGNNGGMEGIIKFGENGFLCTPGDVSELASIIRKINGMSVAEKERISINAIETAKKYSAQKVAELYLKNVL